MRLFRQSSFPQDLSVLRFNRLTSPLRFSCLHLGFAPLPIETGDAAHIPCLARTVCFLLTELNIGVPLTIGLGVGLGGRSLNIGARTLLARSNRCGARYRTIS
jgi:hypothetical protein